MINFQQSKLRILAVCVMILSLSYCAQKLVIEDDRSDAAVSDEAPQADSESLSRNPVEDEASSEIKDAFDDLDEAIEAIEVAEPELDIVEAIIEPWQFTTQTEEQQLQVDSLCEEIGNKLGSVDVTECLTHNLQFAGAYTEQGRPIAVRDFVPGGPINNVPRILIMGGIHGDEYSSISIMFKWMSLLEKAPNPNFLWRFSPSVNPDGLLDSKAVRQNANGVDLNRNFPSSDWDDKAQDYWKNSTGSNPRRFPGDSAASELEVQWVVDQIQTFQPDVIMAIHAPYHLLDFDGPSEPPEKIGELYLHVLGVYPGSLGNYAGINLEIPVVTLELPSAGIMPEDEQIVSMWSDIQTWLKEKNFDAHH